MKWHGRQRSNGQSHFLGFLMGEFDFAMNDPNQFTKFIASCQGKSFAIGQHVLCICLYLASNLQSALNVQRPQHLPISFQHSPSETSRIPRLRKRPERQSDADDTCRITDYRGDDHEAVS